MKFLTPDLITRFRSEDDAVAEPAALEWERQGEAYRRHLKAIRAALSPGARSLLKRYYLHDAKVLALTIDETPHFSIFLELDAPAEPDGKKRLELRYRLVGGARRGYDLAIHPALAGDGAPLGWWLYDEMDVTAGDVPAMTHNILFTGGYEVRLTFFAVSCRRLDFVSLPRDGEGAADVQRIERWARLPA
jgi:hypothetical protein